MSTYSAVQYVREQLGLQVSAVARLADLLDWLSASGDANLLAHRDRVLAYRQRYGVSDK